MALKLTKKNKQIKKVIKKAQVSPSSVVEKSQPEVVQLTPPTGKYIEAMGKRKVATARVRLYQSEGDTIINNRLLGDYFASLADKNTRFNKPFQLTGTEKKFVVTAHLSGSGVSAQMDALVHGIANALVEFNPEFRPLLKTEGLLTRDDRMKETRKIGTGGKARRKRQSPKR